MLGSPLNLILPSISDTMADVVAKTVVALSAIEDVLEQKVTPAGMTLNAELALGGNQLTNVGALTLAPAAVPTAAGSMYYATDGEFYLIDSTGTVQVTLDGQLNLGATGTIVGDYGGSNPARVTYDDASGEYRFTEETNIYADLVADDVVLKSAAGSVRLGATNDIITARSLLVKELAASGVSVPVYNAATSTLEMSETTRATNPVKVTTLDASSTVKASNYLHTDDFSRKLKMHSGALMLGTFNYTVNGITGIYATVVTAPAPANVAVLVFPTELRKGDRLKRVYCRLEKTSGGDPEVRIYKMDVNGLWTSVQEFTYTTFGYGALDCVITSPTALDTYEDYLVYVQFPAVGDRLTNLDIVWDHPT